MDDKALIEEAQKGNKEAFSKLYQKYFQKVFRYCKINLKSDEFAKDICQDSFVKAFKRLGSFKTNGQWSFQAYIFTIARNLIIDSTRKKKTESIENYEDLESSENLYDKIEQNENIEKIRVVLSKLDEVDRQIIVLRFFEEMPSIDVAKILNISDGALRVRAFRATQKMKEIFEKLYGKRN